VYPKKTHRVFLGTYPGVGTLALFISFAGNSELITIELLPFCCLPVLQYAIESLVPRACDINSLNNCTNTAVAKIVRMFFGNNVDFIRQMTGSTSLSIIISF